MKFTDAWAQKMCFTPNPLKMARLEDRRNKMSSLVEIFVYLCYKEQQDIRNITKISPSLWAVTSTSWGHASCSGIFTSCSPTWLALGREHGRITDLRSQNLRRQIVNHTRVNATPSIHTDQGVAYRLLLWELAQPHHWIISRNNHRTNCLRGISRREKLSNDEGLRGTRSRTKIIHKLNMIYIGVFRQRTLSDPFSIGWLGSIEENKQLSEFGNGLLSSPAYFLKASLLLDTTEKLICSC